MVDRALRRAMFEITRLGRHFLASRAERTIHLNCLGPRLVRVVSKCEFGENRDAGTLYHPR